MPRSLLCGFLSKALVDATVLIARANVDTCLSRKKSSGKGAGK